jgi:hypothetical protein
VSKEPKGRITRKEDTLHVGLARYEKPQSKWPWWAVEYGGWIVVAVILIGVIIPFGFWGLKATQDRPVLSGASAKLVIVFGPAQVWEGGSNSRVKSVSVKVANQGQKTATNVKILAVIGSDAYPLQGPLSVDSGRAEAFSGDINRTIPEGGSIQISMTCDSCQS